MTIYVFNKDTGELFEFKNKKEAAEKLGIKYKKIKQIFSCSKYKSNGILKSGSLTMDTYLFIKEILMKIGIMQ